MRGLLSLLALMALTGCTSDAAPPAPSLTIDTSPLCGNAAESCVNAGAVTEDVAGVHVIFKPVKGDPVVAVRVVIDGGDRSGMELWSEDLALDMLSIGGPQDLAYSEWRAAKTSIGASVSAGMGTDYGGVSAVVPVNFWNDLWSLLGRALESPSNDDYLLSYLSGVIGHDYDAELDEPASAASVTAVSSLFEGSLGNRFRESRDDVNRVDVADVDEAWASMLTKERLWVIVVGDVALPDLRDKVAQTFGHLASRHTPGFGAPPAPPVLPTASRATVLDYPDAPSWQITGYFLGPAPTDPDYAALDVAMEVLGHRLFAEVREARGLAYSVGASLSFARQPIGTVHLATSAPSDALPVVEQVVADLVQNPVSAEELAAARALLSSDVLSSNRTPSQIASTLASYQLTMGDRLGVERYLESVSVVTSEGARQALERYFRAVSFAAAGPGGQLGEASLLAIVPHGDRDGGIPDASDGGNRDAADGGGRDASDGGP